MEPLHGRGAPAETEQPLRTTSRPLAQQANVRLAASFGLFILTVAAAALALYGLAIRRGLPPSAFSAVELATAFGLVAAVLLAVLHVGLGAWVVTAARRLADVAGAGAVFASRYSIDAAARERLHVARARGDEIGALAWALERLTDEMTQRDVERSARERTLREGEERMREIAFSLKESEERFRTIVQTSVDGFWMASTADGRLLDVNEAYCRMAGYARDELVAMRIGDLEAAESADETVRHIGDIVAGRRERFETRHRRKDGSVVDVEIAAKYSPERGGVLMVFIRDVTRRKRDEARLRETARLADRASRAKTEFVANMSHEIRTPMNAIIGLTHLALDTDLSARQRDYLRRIEGASKSLLGVLNGILDYSKIEAGTLEVEKVPFSLAQVLQIVTDLFAVPAESKRLSLRVAAAAGTPDAFVGDPLRLGQVLANLVGNAIKFTERGGVRVEASMPDREGDRGRLRFTVADTGIGVAPDQRDRLFRPFSQADSSITRRYGGTGLGLAISKRLVEMMGGEIGCESRAGEGSLFHFTVAVRIGEEGLAATSRRAAEPDEASVSPGVRIPPGARVLLVDDNETNLAVAKAFLEHAGLAVLTARDGREAVSVAAAEQVHAILMDVQMPEMDGLDATRAIRALPGGHALPIIAMTAAAMEEDRRACLAAGMSDHVSKPIAPAEVVAVLGRWLTTDPARSLPDVAAADPASPARPDEAVAGLQTDEAARLVRILDDHELVPDSLLDEVCRKAAAAGASRFAESLRAEVESYDYSRARQTAATIGRLLASNSTGDRL